jgi:hypothetical protein
MKRGIIVAFILFFVFVPGLSFPWCITNITLCPKPGFISLVMDIKADKQRVYGICVNLDETISIVEFLKVDSMKALIGQCHNEKDDWERAPFIIKVMDIFSLLQSVSIEDDSI